MLVLKREAGQTIVVDGPCVITFDRIKGDTVKVLLDGPQTTKFLRGELVSRDAASQPPPQVSEQ